MASTDLRADSARDNPASADDNFAHVPFSGIFPDEQIEAYLRAKGLVGPITKEFIAEIAWGMMGMGFAEALSETQLYPGEGGGRTFLNEMLSVDPTAPPQRETPVSRVVLRAIAIVRERLAGDAESAGPEPLA